MLCIFFYFRGTYNEKKRLLVLALYGVNNCFREITIIHHKSLRKLAIYGIYEFLLVLVCFPEFLNGMHHCAREIDVAGIKITP